MKTVRHGVFETNSSTTHCITFSKDYKNVDDIPLRNPAELPILNEDGNLEVELNVYWDIDVRDSGDLDLNSVDTIIKYLAAHAVFSSREILWSRHNHEIRNNFDKNHKDFLNDIQQAYKVLNQTPPKDIKIYTLDVDDNKIYITKDNLYKWFIPYNDNWYSSKKDWIDKVNNTIKKNPEAADWPHLKYNIGVCGNDLSSHSYEEATNYYDNSLTMYDWESRSTPENDGNTELDTVAILTRQVALSFYHT